MLLSAQLKCDRKHPCQNCTARQEQEHCEYKDQAKNCSRDKITYQLDDFLKERPKEPHATCTAGHAAPHDNELEESVTNHQEKALSPCPIKAARNINVVGGRTIYTPEDGWHDLLEEVSLQRLARGCGLKQPGLLSDAGCGVTMDTIRASLPSRLETKALLDDFFDYKTFPIPIARKCFVASWSSSVAIYCAQYLTDPKDADVMWLGLLFAVLSVTVLAYSQYGTPARVDKTAERCELYRLRTAQCLMIGDISKCLPYTLETMLINSTAEISRGTDNTRSLWTMTGLIVRTAISMGYHRDPSDGPLFTRVQAEFRRRIWYTVVMKDNMASFLAGLPGTALDYCSNVVAPLNLSDACLNSTAGAMSAEPIWKATPVQYLLVKGRLMHELGRINQFNNSLAQHTYDEVCVLDQMLRETYEDISSSLRTSHNTAEHPYKSAAASTFQLEFLYHRGMCALHRRSLTKSMSNTRYALSRDRCITSAMALLNQQDMMHRSTQGNVQGNMVKWYAMSQSQHSCLLAAATLCLELEWRRKTPSMQETMLPSDALFQMLSRLCAVWVDVADSSFEATQVWQILSSIVSSLDVAAKIHDRDAVVLASDLDNSSSDDSLSYLQEFLLSPEQMTIDWVTFAACIQRLADIEPGTIGGGSLSSRI
ncbi:hypothetical protein MRB53_038637 [Persea americana]|nr:hypothetical protein MRB53_038637 [Persea americana]